ncbi:MAG: M81 family metallopeptidase [Chloroflexi bacterium]|nr:M81 family metallopeptidase [Chloroflexota bacterium]
MTIRIAIGRFWTESHSFSPLLTNRQMFECGVLEEGDALLKKLRGTRTEVGGFLSVLDAEGVTVAPTLAAQCMCGGPIEQPLWERLRDGLLQRLSEALPVDGVLLSLHGATVAEQEDDCCGTLLAAVRRLVGPHVPVIATLDMHGNVTAAMIANSTALIAYKTYPHHDFHARGEQAARLMLRTVRGAVRPATVMTALPLSIGRSTDLQLELIAEGAALEESGRILACSIMNTHTGLDVAEMESFSALIVTDNDPGLASRIGQDMMWKAWQQRQRVRGGTAPSGVTMTEAVPAALAHPPGTVVLTEWGDAVTAGFPGDNAELIAQLLERRSPARACLLITDPDLVQRAIAAGIGNPVSGPIGGRWGGTYYKPVPVDGRVRLLFDGVLPPSHEAHPSHLAVSNTSMGPTAVVQVGDNITVIATSVPVASTEPTVFRAAGVEPADYRLVLCKAIIQHRAHFASMAVGFVDIDGGRYDNNTHPWRKHDPKSSYPYREFTDDEIRSRLGYEG